ncbi:uncharacterized protein TRAVEDRAFT_32648 [Trametes versicolor FP-101664 SS1]|uniref:Uncharacterized protein n=1 Tax=Trametes versicolor (strain FP-101664) TaxID=717944 RepID=R7S879_TRAVS|nr:uncharacterized protein TRAVEDRAFT_32648 [Trametes versicolor FP-101664 SS1]EIW51159.1 hypothetical protein TRAVEDRAFT_32648 [Trametes versicolor FP-101664 SS1]
MFGNLLTAGSSEHRRRIFNAKRRESSLPIITTIITFPLPARLCDGRGHTNGGATESTVVCRAGIPVCARDPTSSTPAVIAFTHWLLPADQDQGAQPPGYNRAGC